VTAELCPVCKGRCCRDELYYSLVHMGAGTHAHDCEACEDGTVPVPRSDLAAERLAALLDAERENTALRAEMERLRAEVSYLRACVPPTRPTDYGHEVWTAALRAEVAAERAAVVAYMRGLADDYGVCLDLSLAEQADIIERGEHRKEDK